jgi:hypothetical protein
LMIFDKKNSVWISHLTMRTTRPTYFINFIFKNVKNIRWGIRMINVLIMYLSPVLGYPTSLSTKSKSSSHYFDIRCPQPAPSELKATFHTHIIQQPNYSSEFTNYVHLDKNFKTHWSKGYRTLLRVPGHEKNTGQYWASQSVRFKPILEI